MKFTPRLPDDTVNVSRTSPLAEFGTLVAGLLALLAAFYLVLGLAVDVAARHLPPDIEDWIGRRMHRPNDIHPAPELQARLDALVAALPPGDPLRRRRFRVTILPSPEVNAFALPGGDIVVLTGLLEEVRSENELAMVLAHELGHFAHRDHLRALGRGLVASVAAALLFGTDSSVSDLVSRLSLPFHVTYSQAQETEADEFALDLLTARYGHAGGATDFFRLLERKTSNPRFAYFLATHPAPGTRRRHLEALIRARHIPVAAVQPLPAGFARRLAAHCGRTREKKDASAAGS
ncbi:M48 family metallopeptidase [Dissulfurirhabdus thermomarina]|uniref:M48 family metallopeptidase n=1 Tax=Dissulfurirhabdus thermomarina TaxID=1765737 RepID=A0A6N9TQM7_DISTH|nr:M48 family metallopeptidase [Dissulfurirhabdus thermomarina]NDY41747.1 M48 family metallopeptidase [Dissulfurirhabdus thermomarina]NMX23683.1 M48 family metallopeptidase [Dissulfurirhabdus thermomarina]